MPLSGLSWDELIMYIAKGFPGDEFFNQVCRTNVRCGSREFQAVSRVTVPLDITEARDALVGSFLASPANFAGG